MVIAKVFDMCIPKNQFPSELITLDNVMEQNSYSGLLLKQQRECFKQSIDKGYLWPLSGWFELFQKMPGGIVFCQYTYNVKVSYHDIFGDLISKRTFYQYK